MLTLLGGILGLVTGALPDVLGMFRGWMDNRQELAIIKEQRQAANEGHGYKMAEIEAKADIGESKALRKPEKALGIGLLEYAADKVGPKMTAFAFLVYVLLDALNRSVRPVMAYIFVGLYVFLKVGLIDAAMTGGAGLADAILSAQDADDRAILMAVVSYYFGQRAMKYYRERFQA